MSNTRLDRITRHVARITGLSPSEIRSGARSAAHTHSRAMIAYRAAWEGIYDREIAAYLGVDRSTVHYYRNEYKPPRGAARLDMDRLLFEITDDYGWRASLRIDTRDERAATDWLQRVSSGVRDIGVLEQRLRAESPPEIIEDIKVVRL